MYDLSNSKLHDTKKTLKFIHVRTHEIVAESDPLDLNNEQLFQVLKRIEQNKNEGVLISTPSGKLHLIPAEIIQQCTVLVSAALRDKTK